MIDQVTEPADAAPAPPPQKWTFVRAADGRIAGVCESLSIATGVDVSLVRLAMIGAALWGPGLLVYVAVVLAMPRTESMDDPRLRPAPDETARVLRVLLGVGGALGVVSVIGGIGWADWPLGSFYRDGGAFGITLIAVAVAVVVLHRRQGDDGSSRPSSVVTDAVPTGAAHADAVVTDDVPFPVVNAAPTDAVAPIQPVPSPTVDQGATDAEANRTALLLTRITGWLIVLAAVLTAVALVAAVRLGVLEIRLPGLVWPLAIAALVAAGVALVVSRSIAVVSIALVSLVVAWSIGGIATQFAGPTGTRTVAVADVGELAERYEHAAGWLTLDLSQLALDRGDAAVVIDVRAGRADVVVPDDVALDITSDVLAGESQLLGQSSDGWNVSDRLRDTPPGATGTLSIDLEIGAGSGRVCRSSQADADRHCPR